MGIEVQAAQGDADDSDRGGGDAGKAPAPSVMRPPPQVRQQSEDNDGAKHVPTREAIPDVLRPRSVHHPLRQRFDGHTRHPKEWHEQDVAVAPMPEDIDHGHVQRYQHASRPQLRQDAHSEIESGPPPLVDDVLNTPVDCQHVAMPGGCRQHPEHGTETQGQRERAPRQWPLSHRTGTGD